MLLVLGLSLFTILSIILIESIGRKSDFDEYCAIEFREPIAEKYKFYC